mgnify:CR=1 FL=1
MMSLAIYPGSFDPVTNGHIDIIRKALKVFDKLIVAICDNKDKKCMFSKEKRYELLKCSLSSFINVEVVQVDGLLIEYMKTKNINIIVKGLRSAADFEYENKMLQVNKILSKNIETIFFAASPDNQCISSSAVKQILNFNGNISGFVPNCILENIKTIKLTEEML